MIFQHSTFCGVYFSYTFSFPFSVDLRIRACIYYICKNLADISENTFLIKTEFSFSENILCRGKVQFSVSSLIENRDTLCLIKILTYFALQYIRTQVFAKIKYLSYKTALKFISNDNLFSKNMSSVIFH